MLLIPGAVTMAVLGVTYALYMRVSGPAALSPDARHVPRPRSGSALDGARVSVGPRKNQFEHRKSVFDTTGNLLTSWKHEGVPGDKHQTSGAGTRCRFLKSPLCVIFVSVCGYAVATTETRVLLLL